MGVSVGDAVGALLGEALGLGVGTANTNVSIVVPLTVAAVLRVTVCVPVFTAVTVVPSGMPVPEIKLPMEIDATEVTEVTLALPAVVVPLLTVVTTLYVGRRVGDKVGATEGDAVGLGVGTATW